MTEHPSERFARGVANLAALGDSGEAIFSSLAEVAPDLSRYVAEFAFGDLYSRPGLDLKQRQLLTIASLNALGDCEPQLTFHMNLALNVGATAEEIVETILHCLAFVGFPRTYNSMRIAKKVLGERGLLPVTGAAAGNAGATSA
ncbi:carboxymuconolactone decarboxylase family protein [Kitasatospora sp. LaBMicrA B282]|uniref:carboxymuconolactone decarboxylase family protein n=1 Tax=Kitasatospora sp. LaBMicrA B282 TaxID=3420949 RepID=UPI003D0B6634